MDAGSHDNLRHDVEAYYTDRLLEHGATPRGVDWNSEESQQLRFTQLLKLLDAGQTYSVLDYGCGYGAMATRLIETGQVSSYVGFDISRPMVEAARAQILDPRCRFNEVRRDLAPMDVVLTSGIFNVKLEATEDEWEAYIQAELDAIAGLSVLGFGFNMLTRYSDPPRRHRNLYYADPAIYFALCKERYSRHVAVLHDYDLYEFTVLVRLGTPPTPFA